MPRPDETCAIVPLELTHALAHPGPTFPVQWRLRYGRAHGAAGDLGALEVRPVARLRIAGTEAANLGRIAVSHGPRTVFELGTWVDPVGRRATAGEILAAMSHYRGRRGLLVELLRDEIFVPIGAATVELIVSSGERARVPGVDVHAELQ